MSGTPYKKAKSPTLSAQFADDVVRDFDATTKRMKRIRSDVIQELVRAFLECTADGKTPNFPLTVTAESYRDKNGTVIVPENREPTSDVASQLNRIEAYCEEIARLSSETEIVKGVGAALRGAAFRSGSPVPLLRVAPVSLRIE